MTNIRAINDDAFSPIILRESLDWNNLTDVCILYKTKDSGVGNKWSVKNFGTLLEMFAIFQFDLMGRCRERANEEE